MAEDRGQLSSGMDFIQLDGVRSRIKALFALLTPAQFVMMRTLIVHLAFIKTVATKYFAVSLFRF